MSGILRLPSRRTTAAASPWAKRDPMTVRCVICDRWLTPSDRTLLVPSFIPGEVHLVHAGCVEREEVPATRRHLEVVVQGDDDDPDEVHETALDAFDDADDWRWDDTIAVSRGAQEDERW